MEKLEQLAQAVSSRFNQKIEIRKCYSGFYLRGPNFCKICEVFTSLQILILKQFLFSINTPITLHIATAKGSWRFQASHTATNQHISY